MPHRYKVREIAQQSGLSEATVDRVLNDRPGVRENTRAEVMQAIADLDKQRAQLRLNGRRYLIDVVMQTPATVLGCVPRRRRGRAARLRAGDAAGPVPPVGVGLDGADGRRARRASAAATAWCSRRRTNPRWPRPSTDWSMPACRW